MDVRNTVAGPHTEHGLSCSYGCHLKGRFIMQPAACFVLFYMFFFSIDSLGGLRELSSKSCKPALPLSWLVLYPRYYELGSCIVGSICQASNRGMCNCFKLSPHCLQTDKFIGESVIRFYGGEESEVPFGIWEPTIREASFDVWVVWVKRPPEGRSHLLPPSNKA